MNAFYKLTALADVDEDTPPLATIETPDAHVADTLTRALLKDGLYVDVDMHVYAPLDHHAFAMFSPKDKPRRVYIPGGR
jgi:hypothetical protein